MFKAKILSTVLIATGFLYDVAYGNCLCPGYNNHCQLSSSNPYCSKGDGNGNCLSSNGQPNGCYYWESD